MQIINLSLFLLFTLSFNASQSEIMKKQDQTPITNDLNNHSHDQFHDSELHSKIQDDAVNPLSDAHQRLKERMENENDYIVRDNYTKTDQKVNQLHHHVESKNLGLNSEDSEFQSKQRESGFKISSLVIGVFAISMMK